MANRMQTAFATLAAATVTALSTGCAAPTQIQMGGRQGNVSATSTGVYGNVYGKNGTSVGGTVDANNACPTFQIGGQYLRFCTPTPK